MSNLGTLWFGSDIDLTQLKQKIQSGNQSVLDALKMNYDPKSYQDMVSKLRAELGKETFEIKVTTNTQQVSSQLRQSINGIGSSSVVPPVNMSGLKGINAMTHDILNQREAIRDTKAEVQSLKETWGKMINTYGRNSAQAMNAYNEYNKARQVLRTSRYELEGMNIERGRAVLQQKVFNEQMKSASAAAKQWNSDHMRLNATLAGGLHISTQLGSALSSLFAIDAARQFLGLVIEIGGQLEKQRISIGAILGDVVKANHLFEQIKGLALKSPFGVVELDQYTKQLSAYGFKYSELFDMTKRLADISAGAGTDIGRLTLALGHVRSATYLTGITLRQFSMNNIPMLKMLADYYTEVEKRAVSTAEVQKRISKREVSYEDVIEQIRRLTDEGGMFYNMQEKISESLAAKFKNLSDAMDIMYGEMAEGGIGDALKSLATTLLSMTRHWKEVGVMMAAVSVAFLTGKIRIGAETLAMQGNSAAVLRNIMSRKQLTASNLQAISSYRTLTAEELRQIATSKTLTASDIEQAIATGELTREEVLNAIALKKLEATEAQALVTMGLFTKGEIDAALAADRLKVKLVGMKQSMKNMFMGMGWGTWATLATMAGLELYMAWDQWNQKIDDKATEMKDLVKSRINDLEKMQKGLDSEKKPSDNVALKARVDEMKQVLANSELYTKTLDDQLSKSKTLSEQYTILAEEIKKATKESLAMLDYQDLAAKMIKSSKSNFTWWDILKAGILSPSSFVNIWDQLFNEDVVTNVNQVNNAYKELRATLSSLYEFETPLKELVKDTLESANVSNELKTMLKDAPFEEQIRVLAENGYWKEIEKRIKETGHHFKMSDKEIETACKRIKESIELVGGKWKDVSTDDIPKAYKTMVDHFGGDEKRLQEWARRNVNHVKWILDSILDQMGQKAPEIRRIFKWMFLNFAGLKDLFPSILDEEKADIKDTNPTTTTNTEKKDKQLEAARTRLQEIKNFLAEYKKYVKTYGREKSINILEDLFPNLKGKGNEIVDNYTEVIRNLITKLVPNYEKATEARKKFYNEGNKVVADTFYDRDKEKMDKAVKSIEEYTKRLEEQWKLYREVMKKTGGREDVAQMAFQDIMVWDETSKKLLEEFNKKGKERNIIPISFQWEMTEDEMKQALGEENEDLLKLAKSIQEIIRGNYKNLVKDTADAFSKSLTEQEKLNELIRERKDLEDKLRRANSDDVRKGYQIQIDALEKSISAQRWKAFKATPLYEMVFGDPNAMSLDVINKMIDALDELGNKGELAADEMKAWQEAMEKMTSRKTMLAPLNAVNESIKNLAEARSKIAEYEKLFKDIENIPEEQRKLTGYDEGGENLVKAQKDYYAWKIKEGKALNDATKAVKEFANQIKTLGSELSNLGSSIGGDFGDVLGGIGGMLGDLGKSMDSIGQLMSSMGTGGFSGVMGQITAVTGIVAATVDMNKKLDSLLPSTEKLYKKYAERQREINKLQESIADYYTAALKRKITEDNWLYNEGLAGLESKHDLASNILEEYGKSLSREQEIYKPKQSGLSKWGPAIAGAIVGVVAGALTFGSGAFLGAALGSTLGGLVVTSVIAPITAAIGAAIGGAAGSLMSTAIKRGMEAITYGEGKTSARSNMQVVTKHKSFWRSEKTQNLEDWVRENYGKELFDENDLIDIELAKEILDNGTRLAGETRETLERLVDYAEQIRELQDSAHEYVSNMFSPLIDNMTDAIWDWLSNGESALDKFEEYASDTFRNIAKDMVKSFLKAKILDKYQPKLDDLFSTYLGGGLSLTALAAGTADLAGSMKDDFGAILPAIETFAESLKEAFDKAGYDITDTNSKTASRLIQGGFTENETGLLLSYTNAIRADLSIQRVDVNLIRLSVEAIANKQNVIAETQTQQLKQISSNTGRNAEAADAILGLLRRATMDKSYGFNIQ